MNSVDLLLVMISLTGVFPEIAEAGQKREEDQAKPQAVLVGPCEFTKTDGHLWLHFQREPKKKDKEDQFGFRMQFYVQLAGVDTKFFPLVYFKGSDAEIERQKKINDTIAAFIAEQLKGKKVWIEDAQPRVFAGFGQVLGIVWLDPHRKRSLQQLLVEKGLAVEKAIRPTGREKK